MSSKNSGTQHIQVSVRLRPLNDREKKDQAHNTISVANKEVIVKDYPLENLTKKYTFDKVFGPESKQVEIYKSIAMPLINEVISGYNCTVFAYGQTGTGKTFTMEGGQIDDTAWHVDSSAGMVPRTLSHLIDTLRLQQVEYTLRVSYLELYNEELFDLLSPNEDTSKIRIYEDSNKKGSIIIHGVEEVTINSKREVFKILEKGSAKRQKATTLLNAESSRSHTVFTITVHIKENNMEGEELLKIGKLNLVDLAGSENISRSGAQEKRAREAGNINQSLLTLGRVITALVERAPHIPYRESKLTRLLQESLGGRTKTSIIATISPSSYHLEETISTLEYAYRAKNITNKPEINQKLTKKTLIKEYTTEIERLRQDLLATREKNGVYIAHENFCALQEQLAEQEKEIVVKLEQITTMNERHEKNLILFDELNMKIESFQTELETTKADLTEKQNDLIQTRIALKNAHQAFQEQMHLVSKVDETEKILKDQAKKLLSVANESTSDISKLYDKLDRKIAVESINKQLTTKFVDSFTDKTLQFKSDIFTNLEKKEQTINSQEKRINILMEKVFNYFTEQEKLNQKISNDINDFNQENCSQITSQNDYIDNVKRNIIANNTENLNYISTIQATILTIFSELNKNCIEEKLEINKLFTNYTSKTTTDIFDFTDIFVNTLNKKFSYICEMFENEIREKTNLIKSNKDEYIDQMHERDVIDEQMQAYSNKMLELANQKQVYREREHAYVSNQNILLDKIDDFKKKLSTEFNENQDNINSFQFELANKYRNQIFGITDFKDKEEKSISDLKEKLANKHKELDHLIVNQSKTFGDRLNIMKNDMDIVSNKLDDHLKISNNFAMESSSLINEHSKYITEDKEICQEQFDEIILNNSLLIEQCKESREFISNKVNAIENQMEEFLSKDLKQDLPSGQTPQKKEFSYPLELASTSPHERIIQRFRKALNSNLTEETESPSENDSIESIDFQFSSDKGKSASMSSLCISQAEKENSKTNSKNNGLKKRNKSPNSPNAKQKIFSKKPLINITNNT